MLKVVMVIFALMACCYCIDNDLVVGDSRAKKKKNAARLWAMILLFVVSKVAIFKVVSVVLFMTVFQKLFYFAGLLLTYFMKQRGDKPPTTYGPPTNDYNTLGYSYGPPVGPESETIFAGQEYGAPSLPDVGGTLNNWLFNKN